MIRAGERILRARGHRRVGVGVDPANKDAARLYQRLGYRPWRHGEIATVREVYEPEGDKVRHVPDRCEIYVKRLA